MLIEDPVKLGPTSRTTIEMQPGVFEFAFGKLVARKPSELVRRETGGGDRIAHRIWSAVVHSLPLCYRLACRNAMRRTERFTLVGQRHFVFVEYGTSFPNSSLGTHSTEAPLRTNKRIRGRLGPCYEAKLRG